MRTAIILLTLALAAIGCARGEQLRLAARQAVPGCEDKIVGEGSEEEPWLWRFDVCDKPVWCQDRDGYKCSTTRPKTVMSKRLEVASKALRCSDSPAVEHLELDGWDPLHEKYDWVEIEATACERTVWCGDLDGKYICRNPHDFEIAAAQLAVESGCAVAKIQPEARQIFVRRRFVREKGKPDAIEFQSSWRLTGCGRTFVCGIVGGLSPTITCKAALDADPALPPPPPAPPSTP